MHYNFCCLLLCCKDQAEPATVQPVDPTAEPAEPTAEPQDPEDCNKRRCSRRCGKKFRPWCGSNGRVYSTSCVFKCAKEKCPNKMRDVFLTRRAGGQERRSGRCEGATEAAAVQPLDRSCSSCLCPRIYLPQCGSDGRSYSNGCLFRCAKEKCPDQTRDVVISRSGRCDRA